MFMDVKECKFSKELIDLVSKKVAEGKLFLPEEGQKWQPQIISPQYGVLQLATININQLKYVFNKYTKGWANVYTRTTSCCGLYEIAVMYDGPKDPKHRLACIYNDMEIRGKNYHGKLQSCAFFVFTDVAGRIFGPTLHKLIEAEGLGTVTKSNPLKNPNSGNIVTTWLWELDQKKFVELHPKYQKIYAEYIQSRS